MKLDAFLAALRDDTARLAVCAETGDLAAPVVACPGWDVRALVVHVGFIHRWATHALQEATVPDVDQIAEPDPAASGEELGAWLRLGSGVLADVLATIPPNADTWHPFPVEKKAWVWSRRQAHETAMHRWDAEVATVDTSDLDPAMAADGLAEFFEMLLPRALGREKAAAPDASLHVHCTDDDLDDGTGDWIVWSEAGEYRMEPVQRRGDATLLGRADALLLALMGRTDGHDLDVVGDADAVDAWFALPGL